MFSKLLLLISCVSFFYNSYPASILLFTKDAVVWLQQQTITGNASGLSSKKLKWHLNNTTGFTNIHTDGSFSFSFDLTQKESIIWVEDVNHSIVSDTIHYTLGYNLLPEVKPFITISNNVATLDAEILSHPYHKPLKFLWETVKSPAPVSIHHSDKQKATVQIP